MKVSLQEKDRKADVIESIEILAESIVIHLNWWEVRQICNSLLREIVHSVSKTNFGLWLMNTNDVLGYQIGWNELQENKQSISSYLYDWKGGKNWNNSNDYF